MPQHRNVECQHCGRTLRLTVREESFDKQIKVKCPNCTTDFFVTIPSPAKANEAFFRRVGQPSTGDDADLHRLQPHMEAFGAALNHAIATDPGILAAVEKIRLAGYDIALFIEATVGCHKREDAPAEIHEPTPLVQEGKVVPGAFTKADEEFMKTLRIDF